MKGKKNSQPSMFSSLFASGGRKRKGNLEDMISQFITHGTSDPDPPTNDRTDGWDFKTKKVKLDQDATATTSQASTLIKSAEKEVSNTIEIKFEKYQPAKKDASSQRISKTEKVTISVKSEVEAKKEKSQPKAKLNDQQHSQKSKPAKKGGKADKKMLVEKEPNVPGLFFFDDNGSEDEKEESDLPYWLLNENLKDAEGRGINDEDYDPTTLSIPPEEFARLPSVQKKYWEHKCRHFDKIVAYKMWQTNFFYGGDALLLHKLCDTNISFHRGRIYTYCSDAVFFKSAPKLLDMGHKIVILKAPHDYKTNEEYQKHTREVSQILTRGTFVDNPELTYASLFSLCVFEHDNNVGIVYFDSTTHEFFIGEFKDDPAKNNFRTIVTKIKPVEVIYLRNYLSQEAKDILNSLPSKPTFSQIQIPGERTKPISCILDEIFSYFNPNNTPELLLGIKKVVDIESAHPINEKLEEETSHEKQRDLSYYSTIRALSICANYLKQLMLAENLFALGTFEPYDLVLDKQSTLYLDCQALENLEIFEANYMHRLRESRSLFGYMDKTVSPFGKRMFRKWMISPLLDVSSINERQQAVGDLADNEKAVEYLQNMIKDLPDIQRTISKIYNLACKKRVSDEKFQEFVKNKLLDFLNLVEELEKVEARIERFEPYVQNFKSKRLIQLVAFKNLGKSEVNIEFDESNKIKGLFPRVGPLLTELKAMILVKDGLLIPAPGIDKDVDRILVRIEELKLNMQVILEEQKKFFQYKFLRFSHTRQRYEIEVPEEILSRIPKPKEYAVTSKKKGIVRMHTPKIEETLTELINYETELNGALAAFIEKYFHMFYEKRVYWQQIVSCLSELDCLCGLAKFKKTMKICCRPIVLPQTDKPVFELKDMVHPCIAPLNPNFVPNDFVVEDGVDTYLITGPNMGGKSTLLRQICLAVIMAQIGSFVPASSFRFSAVDRIFTRIGASDRLEEGKSTFFVELEETYTIMTEATKSSLIIVDELGRGTSTYDGVSIAYATLKYIAEKIRCITLFATHYHILIDEFKLYGNIANYHMASELDREKEEIEFKYKFVSGQANKSHGVVIAKMAGLSQEVCNNAKEKSKFLTNEKRNIGFEKSLTDKFNKVIQELSGLDSNEAERTIDGVLEELSHL